MEDRRQIVLTIVLVLLGSSVLQTSTGQTQSSSIQRSMRYTTRSIDDAKAWQMDVRARLLHLLKLDDLISKRSTIPFNPKNLFYADRETYHVEELEINSTSGRRIRVVVTIPNSIEAAVPAVVCMGGHGSNLYQHRLCALCAAASHVVYRAHRP